MNHNYEMVDKYTKINLCVELTSACLHNNVSASKELQL